MCCKRGRLGGSIETKNGKKFKTKVSVSRTK